MPVSPHTINHQATLPTADTRLRPRGHPRGAHSLPRVPASMPLLGVHGLSFWFEESVVIRAGLGNGEPLSDPE